MDYDSDWTIIEKSFWCRHRLDSRCVYFAKPKHLCVRDKCLIELEKYNKKKQGIKRGSR